MQEWVEIPKELVERVRELIEEKDVGVLDIESDTDRDRFFVWVTDSSMAWSTANDIEEKFMPELAKLLKDTPMDFQAIDSECDGEHSTMVIANGEILSFEGAPRIIDVSDLKDLVLGKVVVRPVTIKILPLGNGQALYLDNDE
jgi:hypothetical protein